jgi:NADPH2:quinone reductase
VRVAAAGVNFSETLMRENRYAFTPELPAVFGVEAAGTVEATGPGVEGLSRGTRVAAPLFAAGSYFGGYADHVLIDASAAVPLPAGLTFEDATALMIQGLTAYYLIREAPPRGKRVLISAAAGGVGSILVQLAKRAGADRVIAAASTAAKLGFARSLGAASAVNYTEAGWVDAVRAAAGSGGPDLIYESAGGGVTPGCLQALAPHGRLVIYGALNIQSFHLGVPELLGLIFKNQSVSGFALAPLLAPDGLRAALSELFDLRVRGEIQVRIGGSFPLERAADAHRAIEHRLTTGKIVLLPNAH